MHFGKLNPHVVQSVSEHMCLATEDAVPDRALEVCIGEHQPFAMNAVKRRSFIARLPLEVKHGTFVPTGARQPAVVEHAFKLVVPHRDDLNADRKFSANHADVLALYLKVGTRLVRIGERGKVGAQAR